MTGSWPSSFFVYLGTETKLAKKERGQYPAILTEQTWSIKDLLYSFRGNFACGIQRVVPSGQDARSALPAVFRKQSYPESYIIYRLLTKFVGSIWLDIDLVLSLRVYGPRLRLRP